MIIELLAYLSLIINTVVIICGYLIYRDEQVKIKFVMYIYESLLGILKMQSSLKSDLSSSSVVGRKIEIPFLHNGQLCTLILPYNPRNTGNGSDIVLHKQDGSRQEIKFPPGSPFPYTPSQLGLDKITRYHLINDENLEYTDNQIVQ